MAFPCISTFHFWLSRLDISYWLLSFTRYLVILNSRRSWGGEVSGPSRHEGWRHGCRPGPCCRGQAAATSCGRWCRWTRPGRTQGEEAWRGWGRWWSYQILYPEQEAAPTIKQIRANTIWVDPRYLRVTQVYRSLMGIQAGQTDPSSWEAAHFLIFLFTSLCQLQYHFQQHFPLAIQGKKWTPSSNCGPKLPKKSGWSSIASWMRGPQSWWCWI